MNYIVRDMSQLNIVAKNVAPAGIVMAGPDVLPDEESLQTLVYPMYDKWEGRMPLGIAAQYDSYAHPHADTSQKTRYWTMWQIFRFARDELHSNYIFWNNMTWQDPPNSYTVENAYPVIEKNPEFNSTWVGEFVDTDADGLSDISEATLGTNPAKKDTDGDGLIDGKEVNVFLTDPLNRDTDGGGKQDKLEIAENRDPLDPSDDSGVVPDSDQDGLSNALEASLGTDPDNWDTDGEGLGDGVEIIQHGTNPLDRNTDKDLLTDRIEIEYKLTDPLNPDTDGDGLSDGEEAGAGGLGTDPLKADTDGGGTPDGTEVRRGTNPLKRWDDN